MASVRITRRLISPRKTRSRHTIIAATGYLFLTLLATWPVAARLDRLNLAFPSSSPFDKLIYLWNFDAMRRAIDTGRSPFVTDALFYPEEKSLALYTPTWVYALLSVPIERCFPGVRGLCIAFHLFFLTSFVLTALGTFLLARALGIPDRGAFLSGVLFAFCATRMTNLPRLNILSTEAIPFVLLGLHGIFRKGSWTWSVITPLVGALLVYNSPTHATGLLLAILCFVPQLAVGRKDGWPWRLFVAGVIGVLAILPLLPPLQAAQDAAGGRGVYTAAELAPYSLDLLAPFWPNENDLLLGFLPHLRPVNFLEGGFSFFLGLPFALLLALSPRRPIPASRMLWGMAICFTLLAMGPWLKIGERVTGIPLPYLPLSAIFPPLRVTRTPARFFLFAELALSLLGGIGGAYLLDHIERLPRKGALSRRIAPVSLLFGVLVTLLLLDRLERYPLLRAERFEPKIPPLYEKIGRDSRRYAILDLPFDTHHTRRFAMFYQTVHGKPILFADYVRTPRTNLRHFRSIPLFTLLTDPRIDANRLRARLATLDLSRERERLARRGIGLIVLHADLFRALYGTTESEAKRYAERARVIRETLSAAWGACTPLSFGFYEGCVFFVDPDLAPSRSPAEEGSSASPPSGDGEAEGEAPLTHSARSMA